MIKNVHFNVDIYSHEWKSVINARVKGTVCSVCADHLHKFEITQKLDF